MSHDKLVNYVDINLKDVVPDHVREELLALHYNAISNARASGLREGQQEILIFQGDATVPQLVPPPPPLGPPNRIITDPPFLTPVTKLVLALAAVGAAACVILALAGVQ